MSKKTKEEWDADNPKPKKALAFDGDLAAIMAAPDLKVPESHVIRPQDIKAGDFITISRWYDEEAGKNAPVGIPMEVLATALPFLACRSVADPRPGALDTRDVELMKVSREYAESFMKPKPPPQPQPQTKVSDMGLLKMAKELQEMQKQHFDNINMTANPPIIVSTPPGDTLVAEQGENLDDIMKKLIEKYKNKKPKPEED